VNIFKKIIEWILSILKKEKKPMGKTILTLIRHTSTDKGTLGLLYIGDEFICYTLELPWKDNQRNISCIPAGAYECKEHTSPRFGDVFEVQNVPDRDNILIHVGNFISDIRGCIVLGLQQSLMHRSTEYAVLNSKDAIKKFKKVLESNGAKSFDLIVKNIGDYRRNG
jgi:hypothetical protein